MRDYGLAEWLATTGRAGRVDQETLRLNLVDMTAAIICLRAAGGPPVAGDPASDTAEKAFRLLQAQVRLRPYSGQYHDVAAAAVTRDYAAKRGFALSLADHGVPLFHMIEADDLEPSQVTRIIGKALTPLPGGVPSTGDRPLRGTTAFVSRAISNPTPGLKVVTGYLERGVDRRLRRTGGQVRLPIPRQHISGDGRRGGSPRDGARAARTSELMTLSIERLAHCHLLTILGDPQGEGSNVEREWALRLRIPVIELRLHGGISPHQDGPGRVRTIGVDLARPQTALAQFDDAVGHLTPSILDCAAAAKAFEIRNENDLAHLRAAWNSLRSPARDRVSVLTGMSRAYIEGLLSGPVALELASDFQRRQLELLLYAPRAAGISCSYLGYRDLELLGAAIEKLGLTGPPAAHALEHARAQLFRTRLRGGVADAKEAEALIRAAISELGLQ